MKRIVLFSALLLSFGLMMAQYATNGYYGNPRPGMGGQGHGVHGPPGMPPGQFRHAMESLNRLQFESDRIRTAKNIAQRNRLSSNQVRRVMNVFTFESSRLEFAKFAYPRVMDPANYFVVNDAFNFSSSVRELDRHIQGVASHGGGVYTGSHGGSMGGHHGHDHGGEFGVNHGATNGGVVASACGHSGCGSSCGMGSGTVAIGNVSTVPVHNFPACGMCSGYHDPVHMCSMEFRRIKRAIRDKCFDDDKFRIARQAFRDRLISSEMVLEIMHLMTFESTKLKFAKFAYRRSLDPQNYWMVNDGFTFSSSIRELEAYIRGC